MFGSGFIGVGRALLGFLGATMLWHTAWAQAPMITSEPASQTAYTGATAVFSVAATGAEPLVYAWYHNGTNLLVDATGNTLTLTNVQPSQAGAYHATVSNGEGTATSANANLSLLPPLINLTLSGRDAPDPATTGQNIVYFLGVTNEGPSVATGVRFTDVLPGKVRFSSFLVTQGSCSQTNGIVTCDLGALSPGQGVSVRIVGVAMAGGSVTNQVGVTALE